MQLKCNANICKYNKNEKCMKNEISLRINSYSGNFVTCDQFEENLDYIWSQYKVTKMSENEMLIKPLTVDRNITVDIKSLINIINDPNVTTLYLDNVVFVGEVAQNRFVKISDLGYAHPKYAPATQEEKIYIKEFLD